MECEEYGVCVRSVRMARNLEDEDVMGAHDIARAFQILKARLPLGSERHCVICNQRVGNFISYKGGWRAAPSLMRALDVVGSDLDHFECPQCGAHDRERHLLLYMRVTGLIDRLAGQDVLHFAPERHLSRAIAHAGPRTYRKGDLYPLAADVERIDLLAIPCNAESFDLVIANHVLEHVLDDIGAVNEIYRVLKPGGHAILQTPFSAKLQHTWSDPGIDTDEARLQAYGQEDHVRLFGRDIFDRFSLSGLVPCGGSHDELLGDYDSTKYGINAREPLFLFRRPFGA